MCNEPPFSLIPVFWNLSFLDGGMLRTAWMLTNVELCKKAIRALFFHWLKKGLKHTKCYFSGMITYEIYEIPVCSRQSALHGICLAVLSVLFLSAHMFIWPIQECWKHHSITKWSEIHLTACPVKQAFSSCFRRDKERWPTGRWEKNLVKGAITIAPSDLFLLFVTPRLGTSLKKHKKEIVIR